MFNTTYSEVYSLINHRTYSLYKIICLRDGPSNTIQTNIQFYIIFKSTYYLWNKGIWIWCSIP